MEGLNLEILDKTLRERERYLTEKRENEKMTVFVSSREFLKDN